MRQTKYILEYRYDIECDADWREESVFDTVSEAHSEFTLHVKKYPHIIARVRKVKYIEETNVIARFEPISSEEYSDDE